MDDNLESSELLLNKGVTNHSSSRHSRVSSNGNRNGSDSSHSGKDFELDIPSNGNDIEKNGQGQFPQEKMKTLVCVLWVVLGFVSTSVTTSFVHEFVPRNNTALPDVYFKFVERKKWAFKVSETMGLMLLSVFWSVMLLHKHRFIIVRRAFILTGLLYMMRCITMSVTVLPVPDEDLPCSPQVGMDIKVILTRAMQLFYGAGMSITGVHNLCGDYIYSGHTFMLTITYMFIKDYTPARYLLLHWLTWAMAITGIIFVMTAHEHYTVDVILAYWVCTRLYWYYHTVANNKQLQSRTDRNYCSKEFWFPLLEWSERNVYGIVPNEYEIPLPLERLALLLKWPVPWLRRSLAWFKLH